MLTMLPCERALHVCGRDAARQPVAVVAGGDADSIMSRKILLRPHFIRCGVLELDAVAATSGTDSYVD